MTEITKLLNEVQMEEFERLVYGGEGLEWESPAWAGINDVGIDCICCLLLLKEGHNLLDAGNNQIYNLYCAMMDAIDKESPDIETSKSVFDGDVFAKFVNTYPQIIGKKGQVIVKGSRMPKIGPGGVLSLELWKDKDGKPCMAAETEAKYYIFPLVSGIQIHNCNRFLSSLGLDIAIHFKDYFQYAELIAKCDMLLHQLGGMDA